MNKIKNTVFSTQVHNITKLLNVEYLAPLTERIEIETNNSKMEQIFMFILRKDSLIKCPICNNFNTIIYSNRSHTYLHSVENLFSKKIKIQYKRYYCKSCGAYFDQTIPIHQLNNMTYEFMYTVINHLQLNTGATLEDTSRAFRISPNKVGDIVDNCLTKVIQPLPEILGIDEVYFGHSFKNPYLCVLVNFKSGKIIDILENRLGKTLDTYFTRYSRKELERVHFVTMDMTGYYKEKLSKWLPNAHFAVDIFHLKKNFNDIIKSELIRIKSQYREYYITKNRFSDVRYWYYLILSKYGFILYTDNYNLKSHYYIKGLYPPSDNDKYSLKTNGYKDCEWSDVQLLEYILDIPGNLLHKSILRYLYNRKEEFVDYVDHPYYEEAINIFKTVNKKVKMTNEHLLEIIKPLAVMDLEEIVFKLREKTYDNDNRLNEDLLKMAASFENWNEEIATSFIKIKRITVTKRGTSKYYYTRLNNSITERVNREIKKVIKHSSKYKDKNRAIKVLMLKLNNDAVLINIKHNKHRH